MKRRVLPALILALVLTLYFVPPVRGLVAKTLFQISLHPVMGKIVGFGFQLASPILPVERVLLTRQTIAFYHPRPSWEKHILVIPRKQLSTLFDLAEKPGHLSDIFLGASYLLQQEHFEQDDYALLVNGGMRQDVGQVHFHLHEPRDVSVDFAGEPTTYPVVWQNQDFKVYEISKSGALHLLIVPNHHLPPLSQWRDGLQLQLKPVLNQLEESYKLHARGFSLLVQEGNAFERGQLVFHLTAGPK